MSPSLSFSSLSLIACEGLPLVAHFSHMGPDESFRNCKFNASQHASQHTCLALANITFVPNGRGGGSCHGGGCPGGMRVYRTGSYFTCGETEYVQDQFTLFETSCQRE